MRYRVYVLLEFFTVDGLSWHGIRQKPCIPVIQVPGMKKMYVSVILSLIWVLQGLSGDKRGRIPRTPRP